MSAAGVGVAVILSGSAEAQVQPASRFQRLPDGLAPVRGPLATSNKPTTVVVELSGDPVILDDADAATPMTASQRQTRRGQIRAAQAAPEQAVRALGGTVIGSYQMAYNGLKVRIAQKDAAKLLDIPGVVGVHPVKTYKPDNTHGVPLIGAPAVWDGVDGFHGEGIKVAIIDTGIDYTHADFGGTGTPEAYDAAHAAETAPANPALFGPGAPKIKGGVDLVGDSYNADPSSPSYQPIPHPDPNPLDCNGHGTHVAGTAAGYGVLADGTTYTGPYNASTVSGNSWLVGPGVAPKADLYAIRVFGCEGSTDVVLDAIEWAVDHDMDVINMSLGSTFGDPESPDAKAASNAAKHGVIVVASSGNEGFAAPYITGSPASGTGTISVAAIDPTESNPGEDLALSTGANLQAIAANGVQLADGTTLPVVVLRNSSGGVSLGCDPAEYTAAGVTGKLVVTARGTCARVARAVFGQQAGAAAVLMINNAPGFPPYEGPITGNPDTGEQYTVTIPFLGVPSGAAATIVAADGGTATLTASTIANPSFLGPASFTSGGPRLGDSWLKPDVAAPGVSIASAGIGTGNGFSILSGTSMAAPHTTGLAALVKQAHPSWHKVEYWKAAIVNTADPGKVAGYQTAVEGAGLIQAAGATQTQVVALGDKGTSTLNYGFEELTKDYSKVKTIKVKNFGRDAATFDVTTTLGSGVPHTVSVSPSRVTIRGGGEADIKVTLKVPVATSATSAEFEDVAGLIQLTPASGSNNGVALRVPYYFVPQSVSHIDTKLDTKALVRDGSATATVTNRNGATTGFADWYAWGLTDRSERLGSEDVRAVGVQAFPGVLAFAISVDERASTFADKEFDILVDVNGDANDDYAVVGVDLGAITTGVPNGQVAVAVFDLRTGNGSIQFLADAPFDSTTLVLPALISQLCASGSPCLSSSNPRFSYHVVSFDLTYGTSDEVDGVAKFNAFTPAISTGGFDVVAPNATVTEPITYNATEFANTPALGFLIISHDNPAKSEAKTIEIKRH